jgi:hypothetical protein
VSRRDVVDLGRVLLRSIRPNLHLLGKRPDRAPICDKRQLARLALRTDNLNVRSQRALARLRLVYEGTLRSHMGRQDGTRRDSLYYSLFPDEWPGVREALRARVTVKAVAKHLECVTSLDA